MSARTALLTLLLLVGCAGAAQAQTQAQAQTCRDALVATAQDLERTRGAVEGAAAGTPAQCAALRQHIATLNKIRAVFGRCDTGANKTKNAAQVGSSIATFTKQMRASCKGA
jgi:hypothetical protein